MAVIWKHNGVEVESPDAIPTRGNAFEVNVRGDYKVPIELQSMGFLAHPDDVAEHRRRFPNVELRMREGSAIPVVRNLAQKRKFLAVSGWADTKSY